MVEIEFGTVVRGRASKDSFAMGSSPGRRRVSCSE